MVKRMVVIIMIITSVTRALFGIPKEVVESPLIWAALKPRAVATDNSSDHCNRIYDLTKATVCFLPNKGFKVTDKRFFGNQ